MKPILESVTAKFAEAAAQGKPIYTLTPAQAREVLEKAQAGPVKKPDVDTQDLTIPGGPNGEIAIRIIRPKNISGSLPVILYIHGAGWVMGGNTTHERLMCDLAVQAGIAIVFVSYSLSPEARFPVAIEESYAALQYIAAHGAKHNLDGSRLIIAGDSVGGNMAIALTLLVQERKGPKIIFQLLLYPVTSSELTTQSYKDFAQGPWLTKAAMEWFWNAYEPDIAARKNPLLSPLNASIDQVKNVPPALIITAENDVLRDEGEAYAHKLMQAGVSVTAVRFLGTMHDFMMLNALAYTPATRGAIELAACALSTILSK